MQGLTRPWFGSAMCMMSVSIRPAAAFFMSSTSAQNLAMLSPKLKLALTCMTVPPGQMWQVSDYVVTSSETVLKAVAERAWQHQADGLAHLHSIAAGNF